MPYVVRQNLLNPHWLCAVITALPIVLAAVVVAVAALLP